ncbi:altronate dehydratase family protein [Chakrabartyella piscis]|uniref:UxaA family hydrolase n=1 Tax=Chakrabartyella piscis TaxID=2918914 RepID=UPI002958D7DE|nr:altronate dehydratase family protein [Chakrabartyella piscis]
MTKMIRIATLDNVAVALAPVEQGEIVVLDGITYVAAEKIEQGHKMAIVPIKEGEAVVKYGFPIGNAKQDISVGEWVHVHNVKTGLSEESSYTYDAKVEPLEAITPETFNGFMRADGRAAIRNEIWIIPTVGCVNGVAEKLTKDNGHLVQGNIEGLYAFPHPFGCSQMGDDHAQTRKLLAALANHPNAGGVLVLGLGCENNTMEGFKEELGTWDDNRMKFLVCQDVEDEFEEAGKLLGELAEYVDTFSRQPIPVSKLVIGMKCGGSDGLSGITANPTVGAFSDKLIARGGTTVLTEVPEMFGAEGMLMNRCINEEVFDKAVHMIDGFKEYFTSHNQVVYENPSPGNKKGGITTLEDKSLGCVQKGGTAPIVEVIAYGDQITKTGLHMLSGPGNDLVSSTAMTAAGAHMVLFTTGRGTPFGSPAPTMKISTNNDLFAKKNNWIDFNTGMITEGDTIDETAERLLEFVIDIANGTKTKTEENGYREISIFKDGVVL